MLAALNHPHIAAISGLEKSGSVEALVLELVEGETLAERIAQGPVPVEEALAIARQIADALEAAHEKGIEIRNPGSAPAVAQQGTVIDPSLDFWLGSIAMDQAGDIALGFSSMSRDQLSSVYVAGRKPGDPQGKMFGPLVLANGGGVQFNSFKRWGDYSSMTVDPKDDCTFWYTQEYYTATGSFNWATRIGAFKFDRCKPNVK